jgi:clan AA aspartic protease
MTLQGLLSDRLEPLISLTIQGFQGQQTTIEAVVDTGFNDFLSIPRALVTELGLEPVGTLPVELADGSLQDTNYYPLTVHWMGEQRFIMTQEGEGTPLVGMMLLLDCELRIVVAHAGEVSIRALS